MSYQFGFNLHATNAAPSLYKALGASIVRIDYQGVPFKTIQNLVSLYSGFRRVLLVHSFEQALEARILGRAVELEYKNEIDLGNMDGTDPEQYVHELRMLAAYQVYPWCGSVSTLADQTYWNDLVSAGFLNVARKVAVHLYGESPEELASRVAWLRSQIGHLPLLISEYGPGKALPPDQLADFMARTIKALPADLVLYRGPEEPSNRGWGLIDTVTGQPGAAYGLLKSALQPAT